jgi:hypothetical protein
VKRGGPASHPAIISNDPTRPVLPAPNQNIENNPMHSSAGLGFIEQSRAKNIRARNILTRRANPGHICIFPQFDRAHGLARQPALQRDCGQNSFRQLKVTALAIILLICFIS